MIENYYDENYTIDFHLPRLLVETIEELEDLAKTDEDWKYDLKLEELTTLSKSYLLTGAISECQYEIITNRYGAW